MCDFVIYKAFFENLFAKKESLVFDTLENNSIFRSNHRKCLQILLPQQYMYVCRAQLQQLKIETHKDCKPCSRKLKR